MHNCLTAQICISVSDSMNANTLCSLMHSLRMAFKQEILMPLQTRVDLGLVLEITKKVNTLQHSLAYFGRVWGTKDLKASFLKEHGVLASTPPTLAHPFGWVHSCVLQLVLGIHLRSLHFCLYLFTFSVFLFPCLPVRISPPLRRRALERKQSVCFTAPSCRCQWQVDHNCCTSSSSRRFGALIFSQE